ncbi:excalibur calcium-binding domain-containing protein [Nocardia testacea]|uniref:Excalibur calcium-binding domain-containing protein n=1 Tax=Nocardia testacea TaxID=248551 RepID=A0ABW7VSJ6_9NOCA
MGYHNQQALNVERRKRANRNVLIVVGVLFGSFLLCGAIASMLGDDAEGEDSSPTTTRIATTTPKSAPSTSVIVTPPSSTTVSLAPLLPPLPPATTVATQPPAAVTPIAPEFAPAPPPIAVPESTPEPTTVPAPLPAAPHVSYKDCKAVRAAGAAPIYSGQPGYGRHLDRDGDGVACE